MVKSKGEIKIWYWFEFIYISAMIMFIFGFLWKWIVVVPTALFTGAVGITSMKPMNLLNAVGHYFLAAFIAFSALGITSTLSSWYSSLIFILGALMILLQGCLNISKIEKDARITGDYENVNNIPYAFLAVLFGIFMFVLILFIPQIGINPVTTWFLDTMHFISNIKYLGWIISLIAILNALNIIFVGISSLLSLLGLLKDYMNFSKNEAN